MFRRYGLPFRSSMSAGHGAEYSNPPVCPANAILFAVSRSQATAAVPTRQRIPCAAARQDRRHRDAFGLGGLRYHHRFFPCLAFLHLDARLLGPLLGDGGISSQQWNAIPNCFDDERKTSTTFRSILDMTTTRRLRPSLDPMDIGLSIECLVGLGHSIKAHIGRISRIGSRIDSCVNQDPQGCYFSATLYGASYDTSFPPPAEINEKKTGRNPAWPELVSLLSSFPVKAGSRVPKCHTPRCPAPTSLDFLLILMKTPFIDVIIRTPLRISLSIPLIRKKSKELHACHPANRMRSSTTSRIRTCYQCSEFVYILHSASQSQDSLSSCETEHGPSTLPSCQRPNRQAHRCFHRFFAKGRLQGCPTLETSPRSVEAAVVRGPLPVRAASCEGSFQSFHFRDPHHSVCDMLCQSFFEPEFKHLDGPASSIVNGGDA